MCVEEEDDSCSVYVCEWGEDSLEPLLDESESSLEGKPAGWRGCMARVEPPSNDSSPPAPRRRGTLMKGEEEEEGEEGEERVE